VKLLGGNGDGERFFPKGEIESGRSREIEIVGLWEMKAKGQN